MARARQKYRGYCHCFDHAWSILTKGYITLVSREDAYLIRRRPYLAFRADPRYTVYAHTTIDGRPTGLHRQITDAPNGKLVDHWNGNGLDNRRPNLRVCSNQENSRNSRPVNRRPLKGVSWKESQGKWRAYIRHNGIQIHIGSFSTALDAADAYDREAIKLFGEFAKLNLSGGENV